MVIIFVIGNKTAIPGSRMAFQICFGTCSNPMLNKEWYCMLCRCLYKRVQYSCAKCMLPQSDCEDKKKRLCIVYKQIVQRLLGEQMQGNRFVLEYSKYIL